MRVHSLKPKKPAVCGYRLERIGCLGRVGSFSKRRSNDNRSRWKNKTIPIRFVTVFGTHCYVVVAISIKRVCRVRTPLSFMIIFRPHSPSVWRSCTFVRRSLTLVHRHVLFTVCIVISFSLSENVYCGQLNSFKWNASTLIYICLIQFTNLNTIFFFFDTFYRPCNNSRNGPLAVHLYDQGSRSNNGIKWIRRD